MTPLKKTRRSHAQFALSKAMPERKIAPADQLRAVDDIDMPFTMSALETIMNFGQILEIKTVTLIKNLGTFSDDKRPENLEARELTPEIWAQPSNYQRRHYKKHPSEPPPIESHELKSHSMTTKVQPERISVTNA